MLGKFCQLVFRMERLQHFGSVGLGTSLATSQWGDVSETWGKARSPV